VCVSSSLFLREEVEEDADEVRAFGSGEEELGVGFAVEDDELPWVGCQVVVTGDGGQARTVSA